jgi:hypothetical protein
VGRAQPESGADFPTGARPKGQPAIKDVLGPSERKPGGGFVSCELKSSRSASYPRRLANLRKRAFRAENSYLGRLRSTASYLCGPPSRPLRPPLVILGTTAGSFDFHNCFFYAYSAARKCARGRRPPSWQQCWPYQRGERETEELALATRARRRRKRGHDSGDELTKPLGLLGFWSLRRSYGQVPRFRSAGPTDPNRAPGRVAKVETSTPAPGLTRADDSSRLPLITP